MSRYNRLMVALGVGIGVAALGLAACDDAPRRLLLEPPGGGINVTGSGVIEGELTFDGVGGTNRPRATVYAVVDYDPDCISPENSIHVTGSYNEWDTGIWNSTPGMRDLGGCVWVDRLTLSAGSLAWKFVTDRNWNSPPDYVNPGGGEGLIGETEPIAFGDDLAATIPAAGDYYFLLRADRQPGIYLILPVDEAPVTLSDPSTGRFRLEGLSGGAYELVIVADGYIDRHLSGVVLAEDGSLSLGVIDVTTQEVGSIGGHVTYQDQPSPPPMAVVEVRAPGGTAVVASGETDAGGDFLIDAIPIGIYDLAISATGYYAELIEGVEVLTGQETDVGTIELVPGCTASSAVEIVGQFNNWPEPGLGPHATLVDPGSCTWADTLFINVDVDSIYFMKFRTNDDWNDDDYGSCVGEAFLYEFTGVDLEADACIVGSSDALQIKFPGSSDYRFELDESNQSFRITKLAPPGFGSIEGGVIYSDSPADPPTATVGIRPVAGGGLVASGQTDGQGRFSIADVPIGLFDVEVSATGYVTAVIESVEVALGVATDVGEVELFPPECEISTAIEVVGEFNGWQTGNLATLEVPSQCVWADTLTVDVAGLPGGVSRMKFRRNRVWNNDWGTCTSEGDIIDFVGDEATGDVCNTSGTGTAISVRFPTTGSYRFEVSERAQTFRITRIP